MISDYKLVFSKSQHNANRRTSVALRLDNAERDLATMDTQLQRLRNKLEQYVLSGGKNLVDQIKKNQGHIMANRTREKTNTVLQYLIPIPHSSHSHSSKDKKIWEAIQRGAF
ncbi:hypothetical protein TNCV_190931 [Trichonephila clavipes]|nr:hypothetical protein TNCV_190931 [Trichonephila clavipes]